MALENLQLRSLIKKSGELELSLVKLPVADPAPPSAEEPKDPPKDPPKKRQPARDPALPPNPF